MHYDFNGNMTYKLKDGQGDVYLWDAENRLMQTRRNGGALVESYLYDADGQRVKKTVTISNTSITTTTTFFISPLFEKSGATTTKYFYFNGQRVAMRINPSPTLPQTLQMPNHGKYACCTLGEGARPVIYFLSAALC